MQMWEKKSEDKSHLLLTLGVVEGDYDYDETMTSLVRAKAKEISYSMR